MQPSAIMPVAAHAMASRVVLFKTERLFHAYKLFLDESTIVNAKTEITASKVYKTCDLEMDFRLITFVQSKPKTTVKT